MSILRVSSNAKVALLDGFLLFAEYNTDRKSVV